jgi:hypothetical protein
MNGTTKGFNDELQNKSMKNRTKIKIVKKDKIKAAETNHEIENTSDQQDKTKMASTVSGWISEFQKRRREETETAAEQFGC